MLWSRVAARVKPRRHAPAGEEDAPPRQPVMARASREQTHVKAPKARGKLQAYLANRGAEKRVRRGRLEIGATLDLHGHTQHSARAALQHFLSAAQARGDAVVVVVTGVGRAGEGVLRQRLPEWLGEPEIRPVVSGFAQAHRMHGGAGAYYVFLKRAAR
jgi:DNA-nicking Smr family endonuclease